MRIEHIRLHNLNSLVGTWEIDLTAPAYRDDNLYAIIGPTGAGKTTILDAICLALYGRTPRLARINKNTNDIMSRHTGTCFAEATIAVHDRRYRCYWSQHRARRRADGELQNPKHEIADATSGQLLASSLKTTAATIEQLTGMDYSRFTRAMLLAQGEFAAYLQATPDERAPLLEQITGTAIYSQLSIRAHENYQAARRNRRHHPAYRRRNRRPRSRAGHRPTRSRHPRHDTTTNRRRPRLAGRHRPLARRTRCPARPSRPTRRRIRRLRPRTRPPRTR